MMCMYRNGVSESCDVWSDFCNGCQDLVVAIVAIRCPDISPTAAAPLLLLLLLLHPSLQGLGVIVRGTGPQFVLPTRLALTSLLLPVSERESVSMRMYICLVGDKELASVINMCVCVCEKERERERKWVYEAVSAGTDCSLQVLCVCLCVGKRERESECVKLT